MANILEIIISATDNASKELEASRKAAEKFSKTFGILGKTMVAVGTAITGALTVMTIQWAKAGDEVAKLADKTGLSVETLSELRHAANLSGTSLTNFAIHIRFLQGAITDAKIETSSAAKALHNLGLSYEQLRDLTPEEQFTKIANALADVGDPTLKAALALDVFGRAGTDMLPMLADGSEGLAAMRKEAHDLGLVFDEESAKAAEHFNDSITRLKGAVSGIGSQIAKTLSPIITKLLEKITDVIKKVTEWAEVHPGLARAITIVTAAVGLLSLAFGSLILLFPTIIRLAPFVGMAFHTMLGPIGLVTLAISGIITVLGMMISRSHDLENKIKSLGTAMVNDLAKAAETAIGPLNELLQFFTTEAWNTQRLTEEELKTLEKINPILAQNIRTKYAEIDAYDAVGAAIDKEQAAIRRGFLEQELLRSDLDQETILQYKKELEEIKKGEAISELGSLMEQYKQEVINAVSPMVAAVNEIFAAFDEGFTGSLDDLRQFVVDFNTIAATGLFDETTVKTVRDRLDEILNLEMKKNAPPTLWGILKNYMWVPGKGWLGDYQHGGIVPGAKGSPVPIIAHGGEAFLGSNFDLSKLEGRESNIIYNNNFGILPGDDVTMRRVARIFKQFQDEESRGATFSQGSYSYGRNRL